MQVLDDVRISVQGEWNDWRTAEVRLRDLQHLHWFQPSRAPRPLVHGYVGCDKLLSGGIPHDCQLSRRPHPLLVCVLKSHTAPPVYAELTRRANERERAASTSPLVLASAASGHS